MGVPPLRYVPAAEVTACLPAVDERIGLAARALVALELGEAEMPAKIGVHPRPGALLHAMPSWIRSDDVVGMKWVSAYPGNRSRGLPAIAGLIVLNDPETGVPTCVMDAAVVTAVRTAAVSGVALRCFRPDARSVAVIGAGVQARSHLEVIAAVLPGAHVLVHDRHAERAEALAEEARGAGSGLRASACLDAREATSAAEVVITAATLGSASQVMGPDWLGSGAVAIAVDFATYASAELARAARVFCVDDRAQFLAYRDAGHFDGYPEPSSTLGARWLARSGGGREPVTGEAGEGSAHDAPTLVTHLGVGAADVVFGHAVMRAALERGAGVELER